MISLNLLYFFGIRAELIRATRYTSRIYGKHYFRDAACRDGSPAKTPGSHSRTGVNSAHTSFVSLCGIQTPLARRGRIRASVRTRHAGARAGAGLRDVGQPVVSVRPAAQRSCRRRQSRDQIPLNGMAISGSTGLYSPPPICMSVDGVGVPAMDPA